MNRFKDLHVWQKAVDLAVEVYKYTSTFPKEEKYGLISQINRSVVSISSNIAEGSGRNSSNEFDHFLSISIGSSFELETQLIIANKLGYIEEEVLSNLSLKLTEIQNMTFGLKSSLKKVTNN